MGIVVLQLQRLAPEIVNYNESLLFDTIDFTNNTIDYNVNTGIITFNKIGVYTLRWFIAPIIVDTPTNINFVVEANGIVQVLEGSPAKHSKLHGHCSIKVVAEKTTVKLINISNANGTPIDIKLDGSLYVKANLIVIDNLGLWNTELDDKLPPPGKLLEELGNPPAPKDGLVPPIPTELKVQEVNTIVDDNSKVN